MDICNILGIVNATRTQERLFEDGLHIMKVIDSLVREQNATFVNEGNLYKIIMNSRKQEAEDFQRWICNEVIPMIRRTGAYMTPETFLQLQQDPNFVRTLAENYITAYDQVQYLQNKVDELQPAADKFYEWLNYTETRTIREASHTIAIKGMGLINLFRYFRENGFVDNKNIAYKKYEDQGLFYVRHYKEPWNSTNKPYRAQTMITNKGIDYFRYRLLSEGYHSLDFDGEAEPVISEPLTMQEAIERFSPHNRLN